MDQLGLARQLVLFHATTALFACIKETFVESAFALTGFCVDPKMAWCVVIDWTDLTPS